MDSHENTHAETLRRAPWNRGKLIGPKPPLRPKHVWSVRTKLQMDGRMRDLAIPDLACSPPWQSSSLLARAPLAWPRQWLFGRRSAALPLPVCCSAMAMH